MKPSAVLPRRRPGRPRAFDRDAALTAAMRLFWRHGYEGASLAKLTEAMGVTAPSVYAAYGDKKSLFRAAVRSYLAEPTPVQIVAQAPCAREAARRLLESAAVAFTGDDTPAGCLLASAAIAVSAESEDVRQELAAIRGEIETALRDKIAAETAHGEHVDPSALAAFVMTVIQGLSTLARDGAHRGKLSDVARLSMSIWPPGAA